MNDNFIRHDGIPYTKKEIEHNMKFVKKQALTIYLPIILILFSPFIMLVLFFVVLPICCAIAGFMAGVF